MDKQERQRQASNRYRAKNLEACRQRSRDYAKVRQRDHAEDYARRAAKLRTKENWPKFIMAGLRHRARKRGLVFDITEEDISVPDVCPVLGIPIVIRTGRHPRKNYDSPSVDRIHNDKGYVKGNVQVISTRANSLKSDATIEELEAVLKYMKDHSNDRTTH